MTRLLKLLFSPDALPADFWTSQSSELLVLQSWDQKLPGEAEWLQVNLPELPGHVWFASSGTLSGQGESKWIALSKTALLASAHAVNQHLSISALESWGLALPLAHVGGLGILARAHLLNQKVQVLRDQNWDPQSVGHKRWSGEWLSLVPTQVYDIVQEQITPPKSLKGVIVGGDRLPPDLAAKAVKLGWPILSSYGLTECASQVATEKSPGRGLELLPHIQVQIDDGKIAINSSALFTGLALVKDRKIEFEKREANWWTTQDLGELNGQLLRVIGREDNVVKVRGEKVDLIELEETIRSHLGITCIITAIEDPRDGHRLIATSEQSVELTRVNLPLLAHQKLTEWRTCNPLPRTALGKVKRGEIKEMILSEINK